MPILVVAAVISRSFDSEKRVLIVRRSPGQAEAGLWEFPGGKIEPQESPEQALIREIQEELGCWMKIKSLVGEVDHAYPTKLIRLRVYRGEISDEDLVLSEHDAFRWLKLEEIKLEDLSAADRPFIEILKLKS